MITDLVDGCLNCGSDHIKMIEFGSSGCSDAPKGKGILKTQYYCMECKGMYFFKFLSKESMERD